MADSNPPTPVALITGGTRRVGAYFARHLAAKGWHLVLSYRDDRAAAEATAAGLTATASSVQVAQADTSDAAAAGRLVADIADQHGRLDLLLHNVGVYRPGDPWDLTPAQWDETLNANLSGGYYLCHHARDLLRASQGLILFLGFSGMHGLRAETEGVDYFVSKVGLLMLTRSLGRAWAAHGIRVNMISPGHMDNSIDLPEDPAAIPMRRPATAADLCAALDFFWQNPYVTGMNIDVAGGFRL